MYAAYTICVVFICGILLLPLTRLQRPSRVRNGLIGAVVGFALGMVTAFCLAFFARLDAHLIVLGVYVSDAFWMPIAAALLSFIAGFLLTSRPRR